MNSGSIHLILAGPPRQTLVITHLLFLPMGRCPLPAPVSYPLKRIYFEDGLALAEGLMGFIVSGSRNGKSVTRPAVSSVNFTG